MSIVKRPWFRALIILGVLVAGVVGGGRLYFRWKFPYGSSHCCDKCLMFSLHQYAEDHGGNYPAGEASPEASLSLLYPRYESTGEILRGKAVPLEVVQPILERGGRLGPETCGWHYVEGLRLDDDPRLALCWDKTRLGHNGQRTADGGTTVLFVKLGYEYIPGSKWNEFLAEQKKLLAERNQKKLAKPNP